VELAHPDDHGTVEAADAAILRGLPTRFDVRLRAHNGTHRWFAVVVKPVKDSTGDVVSRVGSWRDIQVEVETRQELAAAENRYHLLANHASDVVCLVDPDRRIQWVSPATERAIGWTPDELIGTVLTDLQHPEDRAALEDIRERAFSGLELQNPPEGFVLRLRTKSGAYRWMSGLGTALFDEAGELTGVVTGFRDVDALVAARALADQRGAHLRATLDSLLDPHVLLESVRDSAGRIVDFIYRDVNSAAAYTATATRTPRLGRRLRDLLSEPASSVLMGFYARAVDHGVPVVLDDFAVALEDGGPDHYLDIRAVRVGDQLSLTWRDVTERHTVVEALAQSERRYRLLAENSSDVVVRLSAGVVRWVSPSVTEMLGWRCDEMVGRRLADLVFLDDLDEVMACEHAITEGVPYRTRFRLRAKDLTYHWIELHARPYPDAPGRRRGAVASFTTVDSEVKAQHELEWFAHHDSLTGLLNRAEAMRQLRAVGHDRREVRPSTAIAFCDIDGFKSVNDKRGHAAGDELLRTVARRLGEAVRVGDLVARIGGDEIIAILTGVRDLDAAASIAEKFCEAARRPVSTPAGEVTATLSIGVTLALPGESPDAMIDRADDKMYEAKRGGGNQVAR